MMTSETVEALERIQCQIARLRELQSHIRELRSAGQISPDEYTFSMARSARAIESSSSLYALLLMEHRIRAIRLQYLIAQSEPEPAQLSLF